MKMQLSWTGYIIDMIIGVDDTMHFDITILYLDVILKAIIAIFIILYWTMGL